MNTIAVVLAVLVFGVVNAEETKSAEHNADDNNVTIKGIGFNGSLLLDLQSLITKLSTQSKEAYDDRNNSGTSEDFRNSNEIDEEEEKSTEKAATNTPETNNDEVNTKGVNILEHLRRILEGKYAVNGRSDTDDNEDEMNDSHADDDDPHFNDLNRGGSSHNGHRYGASLNIKGRTGFAPNDKLYYLPLVARRIIFHNQGYYKHGTPSPIVKPSNQLLLRQAEIQEAEEDTDTEEIFEDKNSYKYEPEINEMETQMIPWG